MKFLSFVLILVIFSNQAFGACDYSKDIKKNQDDSRTYTLGCHLEFGNTLKKLDLLQNEELDLKKAIEAQKEALNIADQRTKNWMDTAISENDSLNKIQHLESTDKIIYFGLGIVTTVLAIIAAGQLYKK
jgi:hypothetical protein